MNAKKKLTPLVLALLMLSFAPALQAYDYFKISKVVGASALGLSLFRFFCKRPLKQPVDRYSLSFCDLFSLKNLWYLIDDGLIGRAPNISKSMRADASGKINFKELCPPQGVIGHVHLHSVPAIKALTFPIKLMTAYISILKGIDITNALLEGNLQGAMDII